MKVAAVSVIAILLALGTSAVPAEEERSRNFESPSTVLARVPEKDRAKRNLLATDPEAASAGRKLFEQHCAECHGGTAEGARRGPSLRSADMRHATPGEVFWIVTNGVVRRGMPAWSKLPEPQRWQIVSFLQEQKGNTP